MSFSFKSRVNYSLGKLIPVRFIISALESHPTTLLIELTNICNANCIYCGYRYMKRQKGVMKQELFERLIDEFNNGGGGDINLAGIVGEPLIDPNIIEKIKYARAKKNIRHIRFSTNSILLQKMGIKKLLKSEVDSILINIGGMDKDTYRTLFGVDAFYEVFENVKELLVSNRSFGNPIDLTIVIKVISRDDVLKNKNYLSLKKLAETCRTRIVFDYTYDSWCGRISKKDMVGDMKLKLSKKKKEPCSLLYSTMTVTWNGNIVPCCRDIDGEMILENVQQYSIDEIWKSDKIKNLRRGFSEGNIPKICSRCGHYEGLKPIKSLHLLKQKFRNKTIKERVK